MRLGLRALLLAALLAWPVGAHALQDPGAAPANAAPGQPPSPTTDPLARVPTRTRRSRG
jgi:hypothetical protein